MEVTVRARALIPLFVLSGAGCSSTTPPRAPALPEHACDLLTTQQISAITGLGVIEARRVPRSEMIIRDENAADVGQICNYETRSDVGSIHLIVPPRAERSAAHYWDDREAYFRRFPGSAVSVPDLGADAWLSGGTTLTVLARPDVYFIIATQMYQERSRDFVIALARAVLERL
jgi:hypothetical protein